MDPVSVALPLRTAPAGFERAVECIQRQTLGDLDIMIVLNGPDAASRWRAHEIARGDTRVRILEFPGANLAGALNHALRQARHDLVARMDADDLCDPARLARQAEFLRGHPGVTALGTAFHQVLPDGQALRTVRPPQEHAEIRWRLLLDNVFCHGSMMLRRGRVLDAGGYDESCAKAQDYALWLRLAPAHTLANLAEVLYTYTVRDRADHGAASAEQAAIAATHMLGAWAALPTHIPDAGRELCDAIAAAHRGGPHAARSKNTLHRHLDTHGPSTTALLAWLYAEYRAGGFPAGVIECCRSSRLREVGAQLRERWIGRVWLWGAGAHTGWLLAHGSDLGVPIAGLVDDLRAGEQAHGFPVQNPASLSPGDTVLLSSDRYEEVLWDSSRPCRDRGVEVVRLYGLSAPEPATRAA